MSVPQVCGRLEKEVLNTSMLSTERWIQIGLQFHMTHNAI